MGSRKRGSIVRASRETELMDDDSDVYIEICDIH